MPRAAPARPAGRCSPEDIVRAIHPSKQTFYLWMAIIVLYGFSWYAALAFYTAYYLCIALPRPRLVHAGHPRLQEIIQRAPALKKRFFPAPIFHCDLCILWYLIQEDLRQWLRPVQVTREHVAVPGLGEASLDWFNPPPKGSRGGVVCVILHGVTGNSHDRVVREMNDAVVARGWYSCVLLRKGHATDQVPADGFSIFGSTAETHRGVVTAARRSPGCKVVVIGVSAGSAAAMRYVSEQGCPGSFPSGWERCSAADPEPLPGLACCVLVVPGYDILEAAKRCHKRYDYLLRGRMIDFFLRGRSAERIRQRDPEAHAHLLRAPTVHDFLERHAPFAGRKDWEDYVWSHNPMGPWRAGLVTEQVPTLFINARDDPICTHGNVQQMEEERFFSDPESPMLLLESARGSHSCWQGLLGGAGWMKNAAAEFIAATLATDGLAEAPGSMSRPPSVRPAAAAADQADEEEPVAEC